MLLSLISCLLLFFLVTFGLAWPLAARLRLDPAEKLVASAVLSLLAVYLVAFAIYLLGLGAGLFWMLPLLAVAGLLAGRGQFLALLREPGARAMLAGQLLVSGWCTGWLWFISSYSGGGWAGDWFEHWMRLRFFLEHWPLDTKFLSFYDLSARPPLANLVTGAFFAGTARTFAHYQLFTALLNSLAFLPAALLVRRFCQRRNHAEPAGVPTALAVLALLLMVNPSFVENVTFAWTKLITVLFILTGLYFFLRTLDADAPRAAGPLCTTALAAAILAHYSAGPYVLLLALAWPLLHRAHWPERAFWGRTALLGVIGALLLLTWFGWSASVYGLHTTLMSNSSVVLQDARTGNQLVTILLNLRDTLVPHFLRPLNRALIAQQSPWGYWRDWCFQSYQLNLFFIFGSIAWLVLARELVRDWTRTGPRTRWFWAIFVGGVIFLGVAVHGARDTWGLAHICLQALVVLGLAALATRWSGLGRGWRILLVAGALLDLILGIALNFAVQSYALDRWFTPERPPIEAVRSYTWISLQNAMVEAHWELQFFPDVFPLPATLVLALLAGILTLAVARAARRPR